MLDAYAMGIFPMADHRDDEGYFFIEPKMRGIIPLDNFNTPKSLQKFMMTCGYKITMNKAFADVISACAQTPRSHESNTWINHQIEFLFIELHQKGHAHSIEVWDTDDQLIGGLYGLAQGGCFNGESMFSTKTNASKIALVHLVNHLKKQDFTLLDTQFVNDHLLQFGCIEMTQEDYLKRLNNALSLTDITFIG